MDAYRGITVLNIDAKVYVMLLLRRLRVDMEERDAFVDFSKAFDSFNHEALWEVLEARGIHPKLISLIKDLYEGNPGAGGGAGGPVRVVLHTNWREAGLPPPHSCSTSSWTSWPARSFRHARPKACTASKWPSVSVARS